MAENSPPATLVQGPLWGSLAGLAVPALGSNLLQSLSGTVSTLWVGRLLGSAALAGAANAHLVIWMATSLLGGIATVAGLLVGRAIGEGDARKVKSIVGSNVTLVASVSAAAVVVGMLASPVITDLLAVPPDARSDATIYLQLMFLTMPVTNLLTLGIALLHGSGDTRTPLIAAIILLLLDAALAPLLIGGVGVWQGWGIMGAGAAHGAAHLVALALLWAIASRRPHPITLFRRDYSALRPNLLILRESLSGGTLVGLQYGLIALASLSLMGLVNRYGSETAAAYGVALTIWSYVQMPIQSVAGSASSIAAQSVGARAWGRVRKLTFVACAANLLLAGAAIVICYALNSHMVGLFLPGEPAAAAIAEKINGIVLWAFAMLAVTMVLFGVLRAANSIAVPFAVIFISHGLIRVPFAYLLAPRFGADAIWWSYPVGLGAALVMTIVYIAICPPWHAGHVAETVNE